MPDPIAPGDIVECVGNTEADPIWFDGPEIVIGDLYTVERIIPGYDFDDGIDGVELRERPHLDPTGDRVCWSIYNFRPISPRATFLATLREIKERAGEVVGEPVEVGS